MADELVPSVTPVQLGPVVSARALQRDPIAGSIDALQDALRFGTQMYNQKKALVDRENEQFVQNFYAAYEGQEIERTETELAQDFYRKTGKDINTLTRSHARRTSEGSGRIRGRKFTQGLDQAVVEGKIRNVDEFRAAYNEGVKAIDTEYPDNDAYKVGFLERSDQMYEELLAKVFNQDLQTRADHSTNVVAQEMMAEYEEFGTNSDPEVAAVRFVANAREMQAQHKKNFPNMSDEQLEQPFMDTLATAAMSPHLADDVQAAADQLQESGVIWTAENVKQLQVIRNTATRTLDNESELPPREVRDEVRRRINNMSKEYQSKQEFRQKDIDGVVAYAGTYGAKMVNEARIALEGAYSNKESYPVDLAEDLAFLRSMQLANDVSAIRERMSPEWIAGHSRNPESLAVSNSYWNAIKDLEGGSGQWIGDAYSRIGDVALEEQWTTDQKRKVEMAYVQAGEGANWEERSQAQAALEGIITSHKADFAPKTTDQATFAKPKNWHQAHRNVVQYGARALELEEEITAAAEEFLRVELPKEHYYLEPAPWDEQHQEHIARAKLSKLQREQTRVRKQIEKNKRYKDLEERKLGDAGLSAEQALYKNLYGGDAENSAVVETLR
jgi:hypothetical protein